MKIVGATREQLEAALTKVNEQFDNNIRWNRIGSTNKSNTSWVVTLKCNSSKGKGHRLTVPNPWRKQHRLVSACWHVHGTFFDALPPESKIRVGRYILGTIRPGDPWNDYEVGSLFMPAMASELCECDY